jgi:hypothetical protein
VDKRVSIAGRALAEQIVYTFLVTLLDPAPLISGEFSHGAGDSPGKRKQTSMLRTELVLERPSEQPWM